MQYLSVYTINRSLRDYFINMVYFLVKITKENLVYNTYQGLGKYK